MLPRITEPVADDPQLEAEIYREMDHSGVNGQFVIDLVNAGPVGPSVIDLGCGPALIPILLCDWADGTITDERFDACPKWQPADEPGGAENFAGAKRFRVMAVDSAVEMLEIAKFELEMAGRVEQIDLQQIDLNETDALHAEIADTVICNTVLHHLDHPANAIELSLRALKSGGRLFIRDLVRPDDESEIESLVQKHVGEDRGDGTLSPAQLLRQSLHASLTLEEIRELLTRNGVDPDAATITSDRHWTIDWTKP